MVGSAEGVTVASQAAKVSEGVKTLLVGGGLVAGKKNPSITQEGFAFVLQDVNAQVWTILLLYLEASQAVWTPSLYNCTSVADLSSADEHGPG